MAKITDWVVDEIHLIWWIDKFITFFLKTLMQAVCFPYKNNYGSIWR